MLNPNFEPLSKTIAIHSIHAYQKYLSPLKGFSCPHRLLHSGESCSTYAKSMLIENSLMVALQLSRQRFQDCATASRTLASTTSQSGCRFIVIPCCVPL